MRLASIPSWPTTHHAPIIEIGSKPATECIIRRPIFILEAGLNSPSPVARPFPESTARAKGPRIFLDYDQRELDDAYDQAVYAPNRSQVNARLAQASELARQRLGAPQRMAYGPAGIEQLESTGHNPLARRSSCRAGGRGRAERRPSTLTRRKYSCEPARTSWSWISTRAGCRRKLFPMVDQVPARRCLGCIATPRSSMATRPEYTLWQVVRLASLWMRRDYQLAQGFRLAGRYRQGLHAAKRHV